MAIAIGDRIPDARLQQMAADGPAEISTDALFAGKTVVLFALPGAFTRTCSARHLPGYVANAEALKARGADTVACLSVNDAFVIGAWGRDQKTDGKVLMLADGSASLTRALGLEQDLTAAGMGIRSRRYAMVVRDSVVAHLAVEEKPGLDVSAAEAVLAIL